MADRFVVRLEAHGALGLILVARPGTTGPACPRCHRSLREHHLAFAGEELCLVGLPRERLGCLPFSARRAAPPSPAPSPEAIPSPR